MRLPGLLARLTPDRLARLGLACIAVVTVGFVLLCAGVLVAGRRDATAAAVAQARNIAESVAQDVGRNLDLYDLSLQAVVQGLQTPGVMALDAELRRMILFPRAARAPYFGFINVLDADGNVMADSQAAIPRGGNFAGRDYFTAQRNDARDLLVIGRPFLTGPGQPATIAVSRRLSRPDGSFAGVVVGSMRLAYFHDLFARLNLGPHGSIALLRSDGMILMRLPYDADTIGRTLPRDAPFFHVPDGGQVDALDSIDRQYRRFLFQRVGSLPLVVGVGLADVDIYAAWRSRAVMLGLVVAALGAIDFCLLLVLRYALNRRERGETALREGHAQLAALAAQREAALAAMAQADVAKSRFLAAMSHELRTPLNSILGYGELLALDGLPPVQASRLAAMRSAGEHLRDVINQVLDFSRVEATDQPLTAACIDLPATIGQCIAMTQPMATAKGLTLDVQLAPDVPHDVMANASALRQVLLNLLGNAVKFTDHGSIALQVGRVTTGISFAVRDTGIGVSPAQRERLFQLYERLDADHTGVAGTGLGLAIAARLVARMGGRIEHEDNPGGGSVFRFALPLLEAAASRPPEPAPTTPMPTRPLRVLVVDDSAMNRDMMATLLQRAGHTVVQAEDGEAALQCVAGELLDVILMDLRMPGIGGIEATRRIRGLPGRRGQTPIIAVTAQANEDGGAALREAGFQACLLKPIDRHGLLMAVAGAADPAEAAAASPDSAWQDAVMAVIDARADHPAAPDDSRTHRDRAERDPMERDRIERDVATFATELAAILTLLERPCHDSLQADLAHRIAGDAGLLGYAALSAAASDYAATDPDGAQRANLAATLAAAAAGVLDELRQRSNFTRRAAMASEKLP